MTMSGDAGTICTFSATAEPSRVLAVVTYADAQSMAPMTQLEPSSEHLAALGDSAFWANGIVFVHKESRALSVALVNTANPAARKANLVALATTVLAASSVC